MVKTDKYVQFEAGKLRYRVVPVTEEIIRVIVSGKEIKESQDSLIIEKKNTLRLIFQQRKMQEVSL